MNQKPPCLNSKIRAFTNTNAPKCSIQAAIKICSECPMRQQCALMALTAGNSLDGTVTAVADGVIQAGVVCTGNLATAKQLAAIAGIDESELPHYANQRPRSKLRAGASCTHCNRPMWRWTRNDDMPEGYVMHYARGYCTQCRKAYREAYPSSHKVQLRKQVDRKRHHAATLAARQRTAEKRGLRLKAM